ncbi:hypothetical protein HMPREF9341_00192 [Cutibacterium acnes HL103PA1]|nr:hypothetical protein HMPREF9341_00192 [Cutibacterium acnes HL103PA1]
MVILSLSHVVVAIVSVMVRARRLRCNQRGRSAAERRRAEGKRRF